MTRKTTPAPRSADRGGGPAERAAGGAGPFALRVIILRPLDESIAQLEHIAGGDLTHEIRGEGDTEMGRPVRAMQRMQQALASSVSKVRDASSQIDTGSRELAAGNLHGAAHRRIGRFAGRDCRQHGTADLDGENERRELRAGQPTGAERVRYRQPWQRCGQP